MMQNSSEDHTQVTLIMSFLYEETESEI